ncbi:MAG: heavy metal translocating P-type ATPase [Mesotoga sp.]|nr:heavy metal translocating P-type ATPase [Mesotoga sp.]
MKTKHRIKGLDCPVCAAKIEDRIKKMGYSAKIDLASQSLIIEDGDIEEINRIISSVEPGAGITVDSGGSTVTRKFGILLLSCVVYLFALITGRYLHGRYEPLEYGIYILAYILAGNGVLLKAGRNILHGRLFDENFLMTLATVGAFLIHELPEAVAVMLFYNAGEILEGMALARSRKSISSLVDLKAETVNRVTPEGLAAVPASSMVAGDRFVVKPGERIPLDGSIASGETWLDLSLLTGESRPVKAGEGYGVVAGTINSTGLIEVEATASLERSYTSRMLQMVEEASSRKSRTERFITKFSRIYTPIVVLIAAFLATVPPLFTGGNYGEWFHRALILLVISCPCALVISVPLGYFAGIGKASRYGVLVKGSNYLEALAGIDTVLFDKTGTLTEGRFGISEISGHNGMAPAEAMLIAASVESNSNHPIARSIVDHAFSIGFKKEYLLAVSDYREIPGEGVHATVEGKEIALGNERILRGSTILPAAKGKSKIYLTVGGKLSGTIDISDRLKEDSKMAIESLRDQGLASIAMLTGDSPEVAAAISGELGLDWYEGGLNPEGKLETLERSSRTGCKVAFVGDGINDAPVIARSDVGIAMGRIGSDAVIETADIVISDDSPLQVSRAIAIARRTRSIILQNICLAIGTKALFIVLGAFGLVSMWGAVFADVGVALLAVLNSLRVFRD